ncbi:MAG: S41 family peptidase [Gemmatimonadales bacterium]|nr:S41 family peptidase [Gemmatimonadales bacterium]
MVRRLLIATAVAASACGPKQAPPEAPANSALTGVWKSDGYGYVLVATGDTLQAFEVTATTCVPSFTAAKVASTDPGADPQYDADGQIFTVTGGSDSAERHLKSSGAASYITIRRIATQPAACNPPTANTPEKNFEVFAQTWAEHYILFTEKGADWPAIVEEARAKVTPTTTPEQLFDVMEGMIARFEDAHTFIIADSIKRRFRTLRKGTDRVARSGMAGFREKDLPAILAVTDGQLTGPLRKWCNDQVQYGHVNDSVGYLRILSESGYTKEGGFAAGLVALEAALDTIFTDPKLKGLVLDVRINFGGADPYGLAVASRLTRSEYFAYSKEARLDPADVTKWTPGQPSMVRPSTRPSFHGPVVELIGPLTISAGETTTQALMGRTPRIIRIGEHTQGVFSDVLGRRLPNGWVFGLPNEVFRTADGKTFDGPGIPPDVAVPVFADRDLAAKRDPGLARAVAALWERPN